MVFVLYRPRLPSLRAQSIQVVHSAHALARRGVRVHLCYEPGPGDPLAPYGLRPHPQLVLHRLSGGRTLGSVGFRLLVAQFARRGAVFLARSKRYADRVIRWYPEARVVLEAHEVDSLVASPSQRGSLFALEARVLAGVAAVVCNCEGVAHGLAEQHRFRAPVSVVHNAAAPVRPGPTGTGVAVAGSLIRGKDLETVAAAAPEVGGIVWHGEAPPERVEALQRIARGYLQVGGPIPPARVGTVLQRYRTLVLPLGRGLFGREFTSPLKAFSYLNAGVPFVGANTPALHRAVPGAFHGYESGDVASLVEAILRVQSDDALRAALKQRMVPRTWDDRAQQMEEVLGVA